METTDMETTDSEMTDMQTSNPNNHPNGSSENNSSGNHSADRDSAANDSPDGAKDHNPDEQQQASQQQATKQDLDNSEARKDQARKSEAKRIAGLSLNPSTAGTQKGNQYGNQAEKKPSLQTRVAREQASTQSQSRKKKLIGYTVGGVVLLGIGLYFYHQIQSLVAASTTGLRTPGRPVRLDSTARKIDPLSTAYEKEAKNRYQDSLHRAIEKDAMGHIVMDWGRLYNVESYDQRRKSSQASKEPDTVSAYGEKSLYDLLSGKLSTHQADSLALEQKRLAAIQAANRQAAKGSAATRNTATGLTASSTAKKSSPAQAGTRNRVQPNSTLAQSTTRQPADNSLFNVVHGSSDGGTNGGGSSFVNERDRRNFGNGNKSNGNSRNGNKSETAAGDEPVVVRAVVHGNHKVASGSKVAFRLLEGVGFQGMYFEKNTILIGIATFRNGRVNFSDFRSKSLSSVSASHGAVASTALPMVCYDTDMVAGIPVTDQSPLETQTRQAGTSALSDAANDVSYSIPYGSLARAASSLTRGVASGKRQQRERFIDLSDNYPVLLELIPPKAK